MLSWAHLFLARVILGLAALAPLGLEGYERRDIPTGPLFSRGWHEGEIRWAEDYLPDVLRRVEKRLGRRLEGGFTTVLVHGPTELERIMVELGGARPQPFTRGVAFPHRRLIIVRGDLTGAPVLEDPTTTTLAHEVAHLVLHRDPATRLPRWLDEGVAEWVSGSRLLRRDSAHLSLLARMGGLYRLETLETRFPRGHVATSLAYQQSFLLIDFLVKSWGRDALVEVLDRLEDGSSAEQAIERVTGLERDAFEESFRRWLAARHSLVESIGAHINVWTVTALLALVAIARYLLKRRRLLRRMQEEEDAEDAAGARADPGDRAFSGGNAGPEAG